MLENIDLLVVQTTLKCNLHCNYCYHASLPDKDRINNTDDNVRSIASKIADAKFYSGNKKGFSVTFHGGECTLMGVDTIKRYVDIFKEEFSRRNLSEKMLGFNMQTNGTLLNDEWIKFFKSEKRWTGVGVSYDGLAQNIQRSSSMDRVKKSLFLLRDNNIRTRVITVLTDETSKYASELIETLENGELSFVGSYTINACQDFSKEVTIDKGIFYNIIIPYYIDLLLANGKTKNYEAVEFIYRLVSWIKDPETSAIDSLTYKGCDHAICSLADTVLELTPNGELLPCDRCNTLDFSFIKNDAMDDMEKILAEKKFLRNLSVKVATSMGCYKCPYIGLCHHPCISQVYYGLSNKFFSLNNLKERSCPFEYIEKLINYILLDKNKFDKIYSISSKIFWGRETLKKSYLENLNK